MNTNFSLVDKERGLYATKDGKLFLTEPGTRELTRSPLLFTPPIRVLASEEYDPYAIVLTANGMLSVLSIPEKRIIKNIAVPGNSGVIETIVLTKKDDKVIITLCGTRGHFRLQDNHWNLVVEPLDTLMANPDTKTSAQCAKLENDIACAIEERSFEKYSNSVQKYLVYMATFCSKSAFIEIWYEIIHAELPFEAPILTNFWRETLDILSSIERIASLTDELEMSLNQEI
ncbi:hypothetical protein TVAG_330700 [Trichomonas vaginalis G3]|uniref:Uncharacterized protein n=1 Tax=Trichomonas vaginalis (strain ATCC PRA-98 / G3) TaxID=412133 RepID=A2F4N6_TRIV3|nr:hypothetical protein TVAGG3_0583590 [Trichomonas vaginalis G3]EAY00141.1 hypothetical protein TVAG_330700 [Trichomonas vaginalis G3]KAI5522742.1 hypothetical protein TVAGG3_0583590 [Trichomonas vaginalis G3]|eukprot:XP_001313070.1 hypothetical protein [Trichomonas vaginalis G3]